MHRHWLVGMLRDSSAVVAVVGLSILACGGEEPTGGGNDSPSVAAAISALNNTMPMVVAGTEVPDPPSVEVVDAAGEPVPGAQVTFVTVADRGSVTGATPVTDANGVATVGSWTVATTIGSNTLLASVAGVTGNVSFSAIGVSGPPATLTAQSDVDQLGAIGLPVGLVPSVMVADMNGNPVEDATVTFAVTAGGGVVDGGAAISDAGGMATINSWTLGPNVGLNTLTATVDGAPPAVFNAEAFDGLFDIVVEAGAGQVVPAGAPAPIAPQVRVRQSDGTPVPNTTVVFATASGEGTVTDNVVQSDVDGLATVGSWTVGTQVGTNVLTISTQNAVDVTVMATVAPSPNVTVDVPFGNNQRIVTGGQTIIPPSVRVQDEFGNGISGLDVTFAVTAGGGSLGAVASVTDQDGIARAGVWTLGGTAGLNSVAMTVQGQTPIDFDATAVAPGGYNIDIEFVGTPPSAENQAAFDIAEAFWESIIVGDLIDVPLNLPAGSNCENNAVFNQTVDDLVIFVTLEPIDGPGSILGRAGPCALRSGDPNNQLSVAGVMTFDTADLQNLADNGTLNAVILHEMGHVIGVGTLWDNLNFLAGASNPAVDSIGGTADTRFTGPLAIEAFDAVGGAVFTSGSPVPVENMFGPGTRNGHWRESVLESELMTGFIEPGGAANPLSLITIASLGDLGYAINGAAAEAYTVPSSGTLRVRRGDAPISVHLGDDIRRSPIYLIDQNGRILRTINP